MLYFDVYTTFFSLGMARHRCKTFETDGLHLFSLKLFSVHLKVNLNGYSMKIVDTLLFHVHMVPRT